MSTPEIKLPENEVERQGFVLQRENYGITFGKDKTTGQKIYWQYTNRVSGSAEDLLSTDILPALGESFDTINPSVVAYTYTANMHTLKTNIIVWTVAYSNDESDIENTLEDLDFTTAERQCSAHTSQINNAYVPEMSLTITWRYDSWADFYSIFAAYVGKVNVLPFETFSIGKVLFSGGSCDEVYSSIKGGNVIKASLTFIVRGVSFNASSATGSSVVPGSTAEDEATYSYADINMVFGVNADS